MVGRFTFVAGVAVLTQNLRTRIRSANSMNPVENPYEPPLATPPNTRRWSRRTRYLVVLNCLLVTLPLCFLLLDYHSSSVDVARDSETLGESVHYSSSSVNVPWPIVVSYFAIPNALLLLLTQPAPQRR